MRLRAYPARLAAARVRALRMAYQDFGRTMATLDRIERLGHRLQAARVVDICVIVRSAVIDACCPRSAGNA